MKYFGIILMSGYFLARERELFLSHKNSIPSLLKIWAIYMVSAGSAMFFGILPFYDMKYQPVVVLLAAFLPVWALQGRAVCGLAGAATAYSVLSFAPEFQKVATLLLAAEVSVLVIMFFYQGARERMLRFFAPLEARGSLGALGLLFAIAVFLGIVWQKAIQIV